MHLTKIPPCLRKKNFFETILQKSEALQYNSYNVHNTVTNLQIEKSNLLTKKKHSAENVPKIV